MVGKGLLCTLSVFLLLLVAIEVSGVYPHNPIDNLISSGPAYQDQAVRILSDEDFELQGWPGNGSESDPYVLNGLSIRNDNSPSVTIRNTVSHFILNNSFFMPHYLNDKGIIYLRDVSNAQITNCETRELGLIAIGVKGYNVSNSSITGCWFSGGIGIWLLNSNHCNISSNRIDSGNGYDQDGIRLISTSHICLNGNQILHKRFCGVHLEDADECRLTNNSIIGGCCCVGIDADGGPSSLSFRNLICYNRFGWSSYNMAVDNGNLTQWDDGIGLGNAWSDYQRLGVYVISGTAQSVDRYPSSLTEDLYGPHIRHSFTYFGADFCEPGPEWFLIDAEVTDLSGVDTVLLNIDGSFHELIPSEAQSNRYEIRLPYRGLYKGTYFFDYYLWANDTLGNELRTGLQSGYIAVWYTEPTPTDNTTAGTPVLVIHLLVIGATFGVILVIILAHQSFYGKNINSSST